MGRPVAGYPRVWLAFPGQHLPKLLTYATFRHFLLTKWVILWVIFKKQEIYLNESHLLPCEIPSNIASKQLKIYKTRPLWRCFRNYRKNIHYYGLNICRILEIIKQRQCLTQKKTYLISGTISYALTSLDPKSRKVSWALRDLGESRYDSKGDQIWGNALQIGLTSSGQESWLVSYGQSGIMPSLIYCCLRIWIAKSNHQLIK